MSVVSYTGPPRRRHRIWHRVESRCFIPHVCLLKQVAQSNQFVFIQLHLLIHLEEFRVFNVPFYLLKLFIFLDKLGLLLFDLLFKRYNEEGFCLVALSCLHDWRQRAIRLHVLLRVVDEGVLLQEVLNSALLPPHLVLKDLDSRLQLDVLLLVRVCHLLEFHDFVL